VHCFIWKNAESINHPLSINSPKQQRTKKQSNQKEDQTNNRSNRAISTGEDENYDSDDAKPVNRSSRKKSSKVYVSLSPGGYHFLCRFVI
jgi:hypothetical protein